MGDESAGYSWWSGAVNEIWRRKGTDVYVVPTSSSVGIGTTQPETALDVAGTITADRVLGTYWNDILGKPVTSETWIRSGCNIYNNSSNVGIGTNAPLYKLHVTPAEEVRTDVGTSTPLLKCYPPPGISWQQQADFRYWKATTSAIDTSLGNYPAADYYCWVNDYADGVVNGVSQGNGNERVHHVFEDKMNDYRAYKELDSDTNNTGSEQGPVKTYGISVYFSSSEPFVLKKYLMQAGSWALGAPFAWTLYGYSNLYTSGGYDPDGGGPPLSGFLFQGVELHKVQKRWSTDYADVQFGVYAQTMRTSDFAFPVTWNTEEVFENGRVARVYNVTNSNAYRTYEFRFSYVHNVAYRTYFDREGMILTPTSTFGNDTVKIYQKKTNDSGDVNKYGISLSQIKLFAEQNIGSSSVSVRSVANAMADKSLYGYIIRQLKTYGNLYVPKEALYVLDSSLFAEERTFYGMLCARSVTFTGGKFAMSASSQFIVPAVTIPSSGVSMVMRFVPKGTGAILTFKTEYDHTRYFDNFFRWVDDENNIGGIPYFYTSRGGIGSGGSSWATMSSENKDKIPKLNAPTPNHFLRVSIVSGNKLRVDHYLHDKTSLPKNGAQAEPDDYRVEADINLNQLQYLCINITVNNITVYLSDGNRFRKVASRNTNTARDAAFNGTAMKLSTIGRTYKNEQVNGTPDGCPMDIYSFYWNNGITTTAERDVYHDVFNARSDVTFADTSVVTKELKLPLTTYDPVEKQYQLEFDGVIKGELAAETVSGTGVTIGQPDSSLVYAPLHNEGRSYLAQSVGVGALPLDETTLNVGGNVQVAGHIMPSVTASDLGAASAPFRELYLSGNTLHIADIGVSKSGAGLVIENGTGNGNLIVGDLTAESVYATSYENLPLTLWSDISGKPSIFPSDWDILSGKPSVFPSDWDIVANKPEFVVCEDDLKVQVPVGCIVAHVGNEHITDPTFADIVGQTVNRNDYIELANQLGIPKSQPTFVVPALTTDWNTSVINKPTLFSGSYDDLTNKPTIPAGQVNSDWNATTGVAQILNKPTIPASQVNADWNATSGVAQILNKPSIVSQGTAITVPSISFTGATGDPNPIIMARTIPASQGAANERTELIIFHANDGTNQAGEDCITLRAPAIRLQTYDDANISDINNNAGANDRLYITPGGQVQVNGALTVGGTTTISNNRLFTNGLYCPGSGIANDGLPFARLTENWGIRFSSPDTRWVLSTSGSLVVGTTPGGTDYGTGNIFLSGIVFPGGAQGVGAVGSYVLAGYVNLGVCAEGTIIPGNALRYANTYNNGGDAGWREASLPGSWKLMGAIGYYFNGSGYGASTSRNTMTSLFVRSS